MSQMDKDLKEYYAHVKAKAPEGTSNEERTEYANYVFKQQGLKVPEDGQSLGSMALEGTVRALDYAGGVARTAAAGLADAGQLAKAGAQGLIPGGKNFEQALADIDFATREGDVSEAFKGNAPTTAQFMERAKVPEGEKYDLMPEVRVPLTDIKLGEGKSSTRDIVGFAGDVALDPLTYMTGGLSAAAKAGAKASAKAGQNIVKAGQKVAAMGPGAGKTAAQTALNVTKGVQMGGEFGQKLASAIAQPGNTIKEIGENIYKSGFKKVDTRLNDRLSMKMSDVMLEEGVPMGRLKDMQKYSDEILQPMYAKKRGEMYQLLDSHGVKVDPRYAMSHAEEVISKYAANPAFKDKVEKMRELVETYSTSGKTSVSQMSDWKTQIYDALPDSAFNDVGRVKNEWKELQKAIAKGFKEEIEHAADFVQPGMGKEVSHLNEKWGTLINAKKPTKAEIAAAERKNLLTQVKAGVLAVNPFAAAGMYAAEGAATTAARTGVGKTMRAMGGATVKEQSVLDPIIRRALIDSEKRDTPPDGAWTVIRDM